jgi:hypothetical protein
MVLALERDKSSAGYANGKCSASLNGTKPKRSSAAPGLKHQTNRLWNQKKH